MKNRIEIKNLTKNFGKTCALDNISLTFEQNKIYGLLGRNGAGKSTLLNILSNRIFADSGSISIDDETTVDNDVALSKIFIMSEKTYYPETMKIKKAIAWSKSFYPDFDEAYAFDLAKQFDLNVNKTVKELSTGFLSIFKLVIALSVNTPYLFLDEPILGLDANNRDLFYRTLIEKYSNNPCTIIISTHLIEEISNIIEHIIIIKEGKIIRDIPSEELLTKGHTISGTEEAVDSYCKDKNIIGSDLLGGLKTAYLLEKVQKPLPDGLTATSLDLQRIFIQLTNS